MFAIEAVNARPSSDQPHIGVESSDLPDGPERGPFAVEPGDASVAGGHEPVAPQVDSGGWTESGGFVGLWTGFSGNCLRLREIDVLIRGDCNAFPIARDVHNRSLSVETELADGVSRDGNADEAHLGGDEHSCFAHPFGKDAFFVDTVPVAGHVRCRLADGERVPLRFESALQPSRPAITFLLARQCSDMQVFGSSGIRGIAGEELTPRFVWRVAAAAGTVLDVESVILARDTRTTGRLFADAAASALAAIGCDVHRLGVVPTPGVQAYAARHGMPALVITASHNPPSYNGMKVVGRDGVELTTDRLERIESRLLGDDVTLVGYDRVGETLSIEGVTDAYVKTVLDSFDGETRRAIRAADLTVALDPGHGAGCLTSPTFFRNLGCDVVTVNATPDGHFPGRNPEPVADSLADLRRLVRTTGADLGIAHDGDADRSMFVDETGSHIDGDASLAALAEATLQEGDTAVGAVNVSQRLVDVANAADATLELTPIGSSYIISRIRELERDGEAVTIAGEGNGGILFPEYRIARDGAYTAARFLALVADRPASEVVGPHEEYANVQINLPYRSKRQRDVMLDAAAEYATEASGELTTIDGFRIDYGDAWVLVRPSGTEPLVRLYSEARDIDRARAVIEKLREPVESARNRSG